MLIDEPAAMENDPIFLILTNGKKTKRMHQGIYQTFHYGSSFFLADYEHYPELSGDQSNYGVADSIDQILVQYPELEHGDRKFVLVVTVVRREDQSPDGGWRWHKWGPYIGNQEINHEYLYDEKEIDQVLVYHIYEKTK